MATFRLNEEYRITSDSRQWIIQKRIIHKDKNNTSEDWESKLYYTTLPMAVQQVYWRFLREIEADNILDFVNESKEILNDLCKTFNPLLDIKVLEK